MVNRSRFIDVLVDSLGRLITRESHVILPLVRTLSSSFHE
jgi:hypothetical protein